MRKINIFIISLICYIFWLTNYLIKTYCPNNQVLFIFENVELVIIGITILIEYIFIKDTSIELPIILLTPFIFAKEFNCNNLPYGLYLTLICLFLGLISHVIRFKVKLTTGKLFKGLLALSIAMTLGGILNNENNYRLWQFFFCLLSCGLILFAYCFYVSTSKEIKLFDVAKMINYLGLVIMLQMITFFVINPDLSHKALVLGWGRTNNVALILLFVMPFTFYLSFNYEKKNRLIYIALVTFEYFAIILTFSRGAILFGAIETIAMLIIGIIKNKKAKCLKDYLIIVFGSISLTILFLGILQITGHDVFKSIYQNTIKAIHLDSFNGRKNIYIQYLSQSFNQIFFGHGLFYPLTYHVDVSTYAYQWGHSTFIHTFFSFGLFGVICLLYHLFEKYYGLIKNITFEKIIILIAFIGTGLYGLIDVSYFYINYMILLIVVLFLSDGMFEEVTISQNRKEKCEAYFLHKNIL